MSLTYGGTDVQGVTYNGNAVSSITYNGVEVWTAVKPNMEDNEWSTIIKVCQNGTAQNYFNVGDSKTIVLNGSGGWDVTQYKNFICKATILGFNHNAAKEGNNRTHFIIGKNADGTKDIALTASSTYGQVNGIYRLYPTNSNYPNWTGSQIYRNALGNRSDADGSGLLYALPQEIRDALKTVTKGVTKVDDSGNETLQTYSSKIDLPSAYEIANHDLIPAKLTHVLEKDFCQQYDYYKNGVSTIRYRDSDNNTAVIWWTRTPAGAKTSTVGYNIAVTAGGAMSTGRQDFGYAITPIFYL